MHNPKRKKGHCPKFSKPWEGPYLVIKKLSDVVYRIQKSEKSKPKVVHFDRLKPYRGEEARNWLNGRVDNPLPNVIQSQSENRVDNPSPNVIQSKSEKQAEKPVLEKEKKKVENQSGNKDPRLVTRSGRVSKPKKTLGDWVFGLWGNKGTGVSNPVIEI